MSGGCRRVTRLALHDRIHEEFAMETEWRDLAGFVEWIYADLFAMPLDDAAFGLDVPDPFSLPGAAEVDNFASISAGYMKA
jgi:hypothetical protein